MIQCCKTFREAFELEYSEAIAYIRNLTRFGQRLGLDRMQAILSLLDHPEKSFPSLHIAGTNGKGSTIALLESAALAAGLRVAKYTSPHLTKYTERLTVNRRPIPDGEFVDLLVELRPVFERIAEDPELGEPTEFEVGTILAFQYFARSKVDLALIEVGMGGRLDATNVLLPLASGITHIDLDHQEHLGSDLASIAREKAGIIKAGAPVVTAAGYPEVERVIYEQAETLGAPLYRVGKEISLQLESSDRSGVRVKLAFARGQAGTFKINLLGAHQAQNAGVAYGLLKVLEQRGFHRFPDRTIAEGFSRTVWPGRLEWIPGNPDILLDGGHNPDGFRALAAALRSLYRDRPVIGLIGILDNRPVEEMAAILGQQLHRVVASSVPNWKSASPQRIAAAFSAAGIPWETAPSPEDALDRGMELARREGGILLVAGSLYLVGHLRSMLIPPGG